MARSAPPLTLAQRVSIAADRVRIIAAKKDDLAKAEGIARDDLARIEAEVLGKAPGWEEATLSGLILDNAYVPKPAPETPAPAPKKKKESD